MKKNELSNVSAPMVAVDWVDLFEYEKSWLRRWIVPGWGIGDCTFAAANWITFQMWKRERIVMVSGICPKTRQDALRRVVLKRLDEKHIGMRRTLFFEDRAALMGYMLGHPYIRGMFTTDEMLLSDERRIHRLEITTNRKDAMWTLKKLS